MGQVVVAEKVFLGLLGLLGIGAYQATRDIPLHPDVSSGTPPYPSDTPQLPDRTEFPSEDPFGSHGRVDMPGYEPPSVEGPTDYTTEYPSSPEQAAQDASTVFPAKEPCATYDCNVMYNEDSEEAKKEGPYSHLEDPPDVEPGKDYTAAQKKKIYEENKKRNNGVLRDDTTGEELVMPKKSKKGVKPPQNEAQIDHIDAKIPKDPKATPGSNSYKNAQVLSRRNNRIKSNK